MYDKPISVRLDKTLGYQYFIDKGHPLANSVGKVYYHRHLASLSLGRWLSKDEHVHHKDGDRSNNDVSNLETVTAEEHAIVHAEKLGKNVAGKSCGVCGKKTKNKKFCSRSCSDTGRWDVEKPSPAILKKDIQTMGWSAIGRKYGVSDNAARKWARSYGLI